MLSRGVALCRAHSYIDRVSQPSATVTASAPTILGRDAVRLSVQGGAPRWDHGARGVIVEETAERIRIKWSERRTWLARKAEGTRWALADSEQGRSAMAWAAGKGDGAA